MKQELSAGESLRWAEVPGPVAATNASSTLVAALEAAATDDSPLFTFHAGEQVDAPGAPKLLRHAKRAARALWRAGVRPGDVVPILLPSSSAFVEAFVGTMIAGAIPAPLATPMTFGSVERFVAQLGLVLQDCGATTVVTYDRMREAIAGAPALRGRLNMVLTPEDLASHRASLRSFDPVVDASSTAFLQYTSGTTGNPKGVIIRHRALMANASAIAAQLEIGPSDVGVSWLPLYHDMGLVGVLCTAIARPYPVHILRPEAFVMQPARWLRLMASTSATISVAPNFAFDLTVRRASGALKDGLAGMRALLNGSEPVHQATVQRFESAFAPAGLRPEAMTPVYGLAEATLAVTATPLNAKPRALRLARETLSAGSSVALSSASDACTVVSVGRPLPGVTVRVVDASGRTVRQGCVGEISVSGPSVMSGYFGDTGKRTSPIREGFLRTGDLGFVDGGELFVVGRGKDVIILGGRNVYPYDVERVAAEVVQANAGAAAFGRASERHGTEELVVVVEARASGAAAKERLTKQVRGELLAALGVSAAEVHVVPLGSIARTTSGKIRRSDVARAFSLDLGGQAGADAAVDDARHNIS